MRTVQTKNGHFELYYFILLLYIILELKILH